MELNDLKSMWDSYDAKLSKNLKINEELLRKMNLDKSKQEMKTTNYYEITGLCINFFTFIYILSLSIKFIDFLRFSIPGFLCVFVLAVYTVFSVLKVGKLSRVNYFSDSIVSLQKKLAAIKTAVLKFRKWELYLIAPLTVTILPILFFELYHIDVYVERKWFFIELLAILLVVFPLSFWINKVVYDKRIKNTESFLKTIADFENE